MTQIKRVLVTGANGFIGRNVLASLLNAYHMISQDRNSTTSTHYSNNHFEVNINANSDWSDCLKDVDAIIHLAAVAHNNSSDPDYINEVNVKGTVNLAQQAAKSGVKRFIFMSSIGVLGNSTSKHFDENTISAPHSQYAESKLLAEKELLQIAQQTGLEVVIIRPVLVYGNGAPGNFGKLVNLVNKVPMLPFALCKNKRSFISVDNLVDFISVCITHPKAANEVFCISDGTDVSIREFTDGIAKGLNKKLIQLPIPVSIFKLLGKITGKSDMLEQLIGDLQVDSTKAKKLLDWTPPLTMAETFSKLTINK